MLRATAFNTLRSTNVLGMTARRVVAPAVTSLHAQHTQRPASVFSATPQARSLASDAGKVIIPIHGTARNYHFKFDGEDNAVKAQELFVKAHQAMKGNVKGYVGSTRFVCKAEWDFHVFLRFMDLDSLVNFMKSPARTNKIDPIMKEIEALTVSKTHKAQNFVADDF